MAKTEKGCALWAAPVVMAFVGSAIGYAIGSIVPGVSAYGTSKICCFIGLGLGLVALPFKLLED